METKIFREDNKIVIQHLDRAEQAETETRLSISQENNLQIWIGHKYFDTLGQLDVLLVDVLTIPRKEM